MPPAPPLQLPPPLRPLPPLSPLPPLPPLPRHAAHIVILAGVCAALHVGKLAPAITALQAALGLTLVQAGFLLSLVQGAGMVCGLGFGLLADSLGGRRSMLLGLGVLALASGAGGMTSGVPALMVLRALEGFGFLLVVLPAPGLVRQWVEPARLNATLGLWGAYMPLATALALLCGPWVIGAFGWRAWWWALAAVSAAMTLLLQRAVPAQPPQASGTAPPAAAAPWLQRLSVTLATPGPWLLAALFAVYSAQWLAVIGFLPAIYAAAGVAGAASAPLTALVAAANMTGNIASGRLLQRGVAPGRLLAAGYGVMAVSALLAFSAIGGSGLPPAARYVALLLFSAVGGLVPGTLFALAVRVAPGAGTLSTTLGWMQQWSALGQFAGPPLVAWVASRAGGWQFTGLATGAFALAGLGLAALLVRRLRQMPVPPLAATSGGPQAPTAVADKR